MGKENRKTFVCVCVWVMEVTFVWVCACVFSVCGYVVWIPTKQERNSAFCALPLLCQCCSILIKVIRFWKHMIKKFDLLTQQEKSILQNRRKWNIVRASARNNSQHQTKGGKEGRKMWKEKIKLRGHFTLGRLLCLNKRLITGWKAK